MTRAASPRCHRCDAHLRRRSGGSARGSVAVSVTPRPSLCSISDAEFTKASCTKELLRPPETQCLRSSKFPGTPLDTLNPVGLTLSSRRERRPWPPSAVDKFFAAPEFAMNPPETFLSLTNAAFPHECWGQCGPESEQPLPGNMAAFSELALGISQDRACCVLHTKYSRQRPMLLLLLALMATSATLFAVTSSSVSTIYGSCSRACFAQKQCIDDLTNVSPSGRWKLPSAVPIRRIYSLS